MNIQLISYTSKQTGAYQYIHIPLPSIYVYFCLTVRKPLHQNSLRLSFSTFPLNMMNVVDAAAQAMISDIGSA